MHKTPLTLSAAFAALAGSSLARAVEPAPQIVAHIEIVEGKATGDHVMVVAPSSEGILDLDAPGPQSTHVRLKYITPRDTPAELAYEVKHIGPDKASWVAAGELAPPPPGKRVLVARLPQPQGAVELYLTLAPSR